MKHFIFFVFFLVTSSLFAQKANFVFRGTISNSDKQAKEGGVKIFIEQDGTSVISTVTASNGKYSLKANVDYSKPFYVVFSKSGMVSKRIFIDYSKLNEEDAPAGDLSPTDKLDVSLFESRDNADFSFLNSEPVGKFSWDPSGMSPSFDRGQASKMSAKIDKLLNEADKGAEENERKYKELIAAADKLYTAKSYEEALSKYEESLQFKPQEPHPNQRIVEIDAILSAQEEQDLLEKQQNEVYYKLVEEADALRNAGNIEDAVVKYEQAKEEKETQYVKDQIATLLDRLDEINKEKVNQEKYDAAIRKGTNFLNQNSYRAAKDQFEDAARRKPEEQLPKDKLAEINAELNKAEAEEEKRKEYDALVAEADVLYNAESYEEAKAKYEEALLIEDASSYLRDRVKLCDAKLAELQAEKEKAEKIALLLEEGQQQFDLSAWSDAQVKYEEVLLIDATNTTAKNQLELVKIKIEELENDQAREEVWNKLVEEGDNSVTEQSFESALLKFKEAEVIKTTPDLTTKILNAEIELKKQKDLADKKAQFEQLVSEANQLFDQAKWIEAKEKYQKASSIDETQVHPKEQIVAIDKILAEENADKEQNEQYNSIIDVADKLFGEAKWDEANAKYLEALAVLDNDHPKNRIEEIKGIKANLAKENERLEKLNALIQAAEKLYSNGELQAAKDEYKKALEIDGSNTSIQEKIKQIDDELSSQMAANEKKEKYESIISEADKLFGTENWSGAKVLYQEALSFDDTQDYPKSQLTVIEEKLAEQLANNSKAEQYSILIKEADELASNNNLIGAVEKYTAALNVDDSQVYPVEQINILKLKIDKQAKIDLKYTALIDEGKALVETKNYSDAIKKFNDALLVKPNEVEPVELANEASDLAKESSSDADKQFEKILTVAEKKLSEGDFTKANELVDRALSLREDDPKAKELKANIEAIIAEEQKFTLLVNSGDAASNAKDYSLAKVDYEKALEIRPSSSEVIEKINELQRLIASEATDTQNEKVYAEYMSKGTNELNEKDYLTALESFKNALNTIPGDQKAQSKVNELSQLIDDLDKAKNADADKKNQISSLIAKADALYNQELYESSIKEYESALLLDMDNSYVKLRIVECKKLLKKTELEAEQKAYKDLLLAADKYYEIKSYEKAIETYREALKIKPGDAYPQKRLDEIEAILNPPVLSSADLEDLGERMDNSILDGGFILAQADNERSATKKQTVENLVDGIHTSASERGKEKADEHADNVNEIYEVLRNADLEHEDADLDHQKTIDVLKKSNKELRVAESGASMNNYAANQNDQDVLYVINEKSALDYQEKDGLQFENSQFMKKIVIAENAKTKEQHTSNYDENLATDQGLTIVKIKIEEGTKVNAEKPKENNDELVDISNATAKAESEKTEDSQAHSYKTDDQLIDVKTRIISKENGLDDERENTADHLHEKNKEYAQDVADKHNSEKDKVHENQEIVKETLDQVYTVDKEAKVAGEGKEDYVNNQRVKSQADISADVASDEDERHGTAARINEIYIKEEKKTEEDKAKTESNTDEMTSLTKAQAVEQSASHKINEDKQHQTLDQIKSVDSRPKDKVKVANSLGEEFPEGVSQEVFSRKDRNGIIVAVVTRRIVVRNSHADVYVKTQTSHATTYQKNGKPSLEHVWQNETQGPELERHF